MPQTTLTTKIKANCSGSTPKEMARGAKMGAKMRTFAVHSIKHPKNSSTTLSSSKMTILLLVKAGKRLAYHGGQLCHGNQVA